MPGPIDFIVQAFRDEANARSLDIEERPARTQQPALPFERALNRDTVDRPAETNALRIETYFVLFAQMGNESDEASTAKRLRDLHVWAGIVRGGLEADQKDDILLVLVGPFESEGSTKWKAFASMAERDDRICRKLLWLPGPEQAAQADAASVLLRTFMARPWMLTMGANAQELDAGRRFRAAVAKHPQATPELLRLAELWWALLVETTDTNGDAITPGNALVKRLIETLGDPTP
jgi:hypothetical protein